MRHGWLYLSLALLSACTDALIVYERDAGDADGDANVLDAGSDAGTDAGSDAGDPCRAPQDLRGIPDDCLLVRPPPRPLCAEDGDVPATETAFLAPDFGGTVGYDLDGFCTAVAAPSSCTNPRGGVYDTTVGGTDNAFGLIVVESLQIADASILASFERSIRERGVGAPMLRLEGWNGLPDDEQVTATFAVSVSATVEPIDWASGAVELEPADGFFNPSGMPLARDLDAYVTEGRLVATIPEALRGRGSSLELRAPRRADRRDAHAGRGADGADGLRAMVRLRRDRGDRSARALSGGRALARRRLELADPRGRRSRSAGRRHVGARVQRDQPRDSLHGGPSRALG
jgi:hypothetical protein